MTSDGRGVSLLNLYYFQKGEFNLHEFGNDDNETEFNRGSYDLFS
jgi:hypothetical protein